MLFIRIILFAVPIAFFFLDRDWARAAACAAGAGALLFWALEPRENHRLVAWAVTALGAVVALSRVEDFVWLGIAVPVVVLVALEFIARHTQSDDPPTAAVFAGGAICALAGFGLTVVGTAAPVMPGGAVPQRVVVFGDSLSAGISSDGVSRLWPEILQQKLGPDARVLNFSRAGDTADDSWERWKEEVQSGRWIDDRGWQPDLIIVLLGGNDVLQQKGQASLQRDLETWATGLEQTNARVLFISVPGRVFGDTYSGTWRTVADAHGFAWMNEDALRSIFTSAGMTTMDHVHLSQRGHDYLAEQVYERIVGK